MLPNPGQIAKHLADILDTRHIATFVYGSFARGDAAPESDLDLCLVVDALDGGLMTRIRSGVSEMASGCEINPWIITQDELLNHPIYFGAVKLHVEGVLIAGQLEVPAVTTTDLIHCSNQLATEALMSCRHYQVTGEASSLPRNKTARYILKPLRHALRINAFARHRRRLTNPEIEAQFSIGETSSIDELGAVALDLVRCQHRFQSPKSAG